MKMYRVKHGKSLWVGCLNIRWGNENAVDGSRIPWYIEALWWPRLPGKPTRCLFSNYKGG